MQDAIKLGEVKREGDTLVHAVLSHPWCEVTYILSAPDFIGILLGASGDPMPQTLGEAARVYAERHHDQFVAILAEARQGPFRADRNGFVVGKICTANGGEVRACFTRWDDTRPVVMQAEAVSHDHARELILSRWLELAEVDRRRLFRIARPWAA